MGYRDCKPPHPNTERTDPLRPVGKNVNPQQDQSEQHFSTQSGMVLTSSKYAYSEQTFPKPHSCGLHAARAREGTGPVDEQMKQRQGHQCGCRSGRARDGTGPVDGQRTAARASTPSSVRKGPVRVCRQLTAKWAGRGSFPKPQMRGAYSKVGTRPQLGRHRQKPPSRPARPAIHPPPIFLPARRGSRIRASRPRAVGCHQ